VFASIAFPKKISEHPIHIDNDFWYALAIQGKKVVKTKLVHDNALAVYF
jgi:hypothetical protein